MKNDVITKILLIGILILALAIRVYKLDSIPPSISWDEAAVGYNSWTIANYGKDEYGKTFPFYFRSFGDDKHPIHVYITALSIKLFGLNEFSTRFPSAFFGVMNVLLLYLLTRLLFGSSIIGLASAFFLAISPYNIHFSRFNHEANFALFFFLLGLVLFFFSVKRGKKLLPFSVLSFAICFLTYHPCEVIVPTLFIILLILYWKKIIQQRIQILYSALIGVTFLIIIFLNPPLLGLARVNQTSLNLREVENTQLFKLTKSELLGKMNLVAIQYTWHFTPPFLFFTGDKNPRLSSQTGEFYKLDTIFLLLGFIYLIRKRTKESTFIISWALLAPLPSALVAESPHAARAMFMMGSWHIIAALGFYQFLSIFKKPIWKVIMIAIVGIILSFSLWNYLNYYFGEYTKRYAIEWQYGMKQIVEFIKNHPEYDQVYMTDARSQPYIFFLYYLKTPLPEYLNSTLFNNQANRSYNTVSGFDKYYFGGWDPIESLPNEGVLYVVTPSQYDGLRYKGSFDTKLIIYYSNGVAAFYLVSKKI